MTDVLTIARSAVSALGCRPGQLLYDDMVSTAALHLWQFDETHPDADYPLRRTVARRGAITVLRRHKNHDTIDMDTLREIPAREHRTAESLYAECPTKSRHHERDGALIVAWLKGDPVVEIGARHGVHHSSVSKIAHGWASRVAS